MVARRRVEEAQTEVQDAEQKIRRAEEPAQDQSLEKVGLVSSCWLTHPQPAWTAACTPVRGCAWGAAAAQAL